MNAVLSIFLLGLGLQTVEPPAPNSPTLLFQTSDQKIKEISLEELKSKCKHLIISFADPLYHKKKRYEALELKTVLEEGFGAEFKSPKYTDVVFVGADGYQAVGKVGKLEERGGYLVYKDLDFPNWEPVERKQILPGPFYVVWTGSDQYPDNGYPWPYQLQSLKIVTFEEQYARVLPTGAEKDSAAYRGYEIFKQECIRCHSINQQGGKIGPDLNAPMSILDYRPLPQVKEFILHPSKFRYTNMPDHPFISNKQLDDLIAFFKLKSKQPKT